jgi:hypothetical protein
MEMPKDVLIVSTKDNPELKEFFTRLESGDTVQLSPKGTKFTFTEYSDDVARLEIDEIAFKGVPATPSGEEPVSVKAVRSAKDEAVESEMGGAMKGMMGEAPDENITGAMPV